MVHNAVHNAFLNTFTMRTAFPRVPLEMTHAVDPKHGWSQPMSNCDVSGDGSLQTLAHDKSRSCTNKHVQCKNAQQQLQDHTLLSRKYDTALPQRQQNRNCGNMETTQ